MPRTAVFMPSLDAFESHTDPISHDELNEFEDAPVVFRRNPNNAPYQLSSLLSHFERHKENNPLTRAPVEMNDLEAVLTPYNHEAYGRTVAQLAAHGWSDSRYVASDVAAHEQYARKARILYDMPHHGSKLTRYVLNDLFPIENGTLWGHFCHVLREEGGAGAARLHLDLELCLQDFAELAMGCKLLSEYVGAFLRQRFKAWAVCENTTPVWFAANQLCKDFLTVYERFGSSTPLKMGKGRIVSMILAHASAAPSVCIANHPNEAVSVVMHIDAHLLAYLLGDATEEERAFFRTPRSPLAIATRLFELEERRPLSEPFALELSKGRLRRWVVASPLWDSDADGDHWLKLDTVIASRQSIPVCDPYETNATLTTLRRSLHAIEADNRASEERERAERRQAQEEEDARRAEEEEARRAEEEARRAEEEERRRQAYERRLQAIEESRRAVTERLESHQYAARRRLRRIEDRQRRLEAGEASSPEAATSSVASTVSSDDAEERAHDEDVSDREEEQAHDDDVSDNEAPGHDASESD